MKIDHLINGQSVAGSDYFESVNPATQEVLAEVALGGEAQVNAAVAAAKAAFPQWANTPATERAKVSTMLTPNFYRTDYAAIDAFVLERCATLVPLAPPGPSTASILGFHRSMQGNGSNGRNCSKIRSQQV
jgi:delta 1-pyrroline-5-carboxylate dehydrogenase